MATSFERWEFPGLLMPILALGMVWVATKQYADRISHSLTSGTYNTLSIGQIAPSFVL